MNIHSRRPGLSASGASAIVGVRAYGFIDLEGAKVSAIIVEYGREILARSVDAGTFAISDYTIRQILLHGRESAIERAGETAAGNEGGVVKVYVSDRPEPSQGGGAERGRYVIVEVETDYTLSGQNIDYRAAMAVGVVQQKAIESTEGTIPPCRAEVVNYEIVERQDRRGKKTAVALARDGEIVLPEFAEGSGWTINRIGAGAFHARHCYSEYTGRYEDFELPYAIFVPKQEVLEANCGKVALVLHMEHAGANSAEPLASLASSRAAVRHAGEEVQSDNPAIVVVPQIEESRRTTNDQMASSEANAAIWQLVDSVLARFRGARLLARRETDAPGGGIAWISFSGGSHMATWKYGYRLHEPFRWLYSRRRDEEGRRGKLGKLKNPWLGRDANGKVRDGSGTAGLNSAQFTPHGPDPAFGEGWKPMPGLSRRCPQS